MQSTVPIFQKIRD